MPAQVVLADHLCERAMGLDEGVEGAEILPDVRPHLLSQTLRQGVRESLLGDLREVDSGAFCLGIKIRIERDGHRTLPCARIIERISHARFSPGGYMGNLPVLKHGGQEAARSRSGE